MYWKPEPKRHGFAWWALLLPAIIYSAGVVVYAHNAFVPGMTQLNGHALGSALMVFGGESGTLAAAAEVFRKSRVKETNVFDWAGLLVSLVATLGNLFVVYVSLTDVPAWWLLWVRANGPLVLLLCSGVDFYAGIMEFGFYNASFDARWAAWNDAKHAWVQTQETRTAKAQAIVEIAQANDAPQEIAESDAQANDETHLCDLCKREFGSVQALSAHKRFCNA